MRINKVVILTIFLSVLMVPVHAAQSSDNMQGMSMSGSNQMDMQKDIDKMKSDMVKMHTNMSNAKTPEAMQKVMQDQMQMIQKCIDMMQKMQDSMMTMMGH